MFVSVSGLLPVSANACGRTRAESGVRAEHGVAAALVDADGQLLALETNTEGPDRTQHAEMRLVIRHVLGTEKKIPKGATVVSTLKPCRMCAATIFQHSENFESLKIFYRDFDGGPFGRSTIFDIDSPDRRRWLPQPLCAHPLQRQIFYADFTLNDG